MLLPSVLLCALQARFERGLTFAEFVTIIMTEPPKAIKLKDVVTRATLMGKGLPGMKGKLKQAVASVEQDGEAVASAAAPDQ